MAAQPPRIAPALLRWYDRHRRDLPWRAPPGTRADPYRVWLAEIMLQQTTVATVIPYYRKFLRRWPDLPALATAPLEDILAAWAGLGYYSRAHNLHRCAQTVVAEHAGSFPDTEAGLLRLPGIGPYTAAAMAAIAFDLPANVVDGNVERVISRLFAMETPPARVKAEVRRIAAGLVPKRRPGDYAQALMDLGATICTPRAPDCPRCPLAGNCAARATGRSGDYPRRPARMIRPRRHGIVFLLTDPQGHLWLRRRPPHGLLRGMLEFPSSPWQDHPPRLTDALGAEAGLPAFPAWHTLPVRIRHVFTHFELELVVCHARAGKKRPQGLWLSPDEAAKAGLPGLMQKILKESKLFLAPSGTG